MSETSAGVMFPIQAEPATPSRMVDTKTCFSMFQKNLSWHGNGKAFQTFKRKSRKLVLVYENEWFARQLRFERNVCFATTLCFLAQLGF